MRWSVWISGLCLVSGCLRSPVGGGGSDAGTSGPDTTTSPTSSAGVTGSPSSVSTTSTTNPSTTDSSTDDTSVFTSGGDGPASVECDPWIEDCPDGYKCSAWANDGGNTWNAYQCVPIDPDPKGMYEPCTAQGNGVSGHDDCDIHLQCWDVDAQTGMGECVGLCTGNPNEPGCADPKATCIVTGDGVLILCLPGCNPLLDECDRDEVCVPNSSGSDFICVADASGDAGGYGDPCEFVNVCDPGLVCVGSDNVPGCVGNVGCCTEFCDIDDPLGNDQCPGAAGGEACVSWWEPGSAPPELDNVGACVIPA